MNIYTIYSLYRLDVSIVVIAEPLGSLTVILMFPGFFLSGTNLFRLFPQCLKLSFRATSCEIVA